MSIWDDIGGGIDWLNRAIYGKDRATDPPGSSTTHGIPAAIRRGGPAKKSTGSSPDPKPSTFKSGDTVAADPGASMAGQIMDMMSGLFGTKISAGDALHMAQGMNAAGVKLNSQEGLALLMNRAAQLNQASMPNPLDWQTKYMQALAPALQQANQGTLDFAKQVGGKIAPSGFGAGLANQAIGTTKADLGSQLAASQNAMLPTIAYDQMMQRMNQTIAAAMGNTPQNLMLAHIFPGVLNPANTPQNSLISSLAMGGASADQITKALQGQTATTLGGT